MRRLRDRAAPGIRRAGAVVAAGGVAAAIVAAVPVWGSELRGFVLADLDAPLRDAQGWLETNASRDDRLVVDDAMWVDLVRAGWDRDNVVWYYKVDTDPAVQAQSPNGWRDVDYVVTTNSMRTFPDGFPQVQQAIENSTIVAAFGAGDQAVEVRRVDPRGADEADADAARQVAVAAETGTELARNPGLTVSASDRDLLTGGRVDPRISVALGSLPADETAPVGGFPALEGEDDRARRQVLVSELGGEPAVVGGVPSSEAAQLLDALDAGGMTPTAVDAGPDGLLITFPYSVDPARIVT